MLLLTTSSCWFLILIRNVPFQFRSDPSPLVCCRCSCIWPHRWHSASLSSVWSIYGLRARTLSASTSRRDELYERIKTTKSAVVMLIVDLYISFLFILFRHNSASVLEIWKPGMNESSTEWSVWYWIKFWLSLLMYKMLLGELTSYHCCFVTDTRVISHRPTNWDREKLLC